MELIISAISGAVGGNLAGFTFRSLDLGLAGNSVAGLVGGAIGGLLFGGFGFWQTGSAELAAIFGYVAAGGVCGSVLPPLIGMIFNAGGD